MKNFIIFIIYLIRLVFICLKYKNIYFDLDFYKEHKLKLSETFRYKTLEILLIEQYVKRNPEMEEKKIMENVTIEFVNIYEKYFKLKEN